MFCLLAVCTGTALALWVFWSGQRVGNHTPNSANSQLMQSSKPPSKTDYWKPPARADIMNQERQKAEVTELQCFTLNTDWICHIYHVLCHVIPTLSFSNTSCIELSFEIETKLSIVSIFKASLKGGRYQAQKTDQPISNILHIFNKLHGSDNSWKLTVNEVHTSFLTLHVPYRNTAVSTGTIPSQINTVHTPILLKHISALFFKFII